MASMEALTIILAAIALAALFISAVQIGNLTVLAVRQPGIGRVLFLSIVSLKFWAALILIYFLVPAFYPQLLDRGARDWIRLFLAVYLVVHPVAVNIAVWRWRHQKE